MMILLLLLFVLFISTYIVNNLFSFSLQACSVNAVFNIWDAIWQDCSWSKYTSIGGIGFPLWRHTFKMVAMTSFQAEKCCQLMSARRICSSVHQFLIFSTFVLVFCSRENGRLTKLVRRTRDRCLHVLRVVTAKLTHTSYRPYWTPSLWKVSCWTLTRPCK